MLRQNRIHRRFLAKAFLASDLNPDILSLDGSARFAFEIKPCAGKTKD
jgi:hypothetical protein